MEKEARDRFLSSRNTASGQSTDLLLVRQTDDVHGQIEDLLADFTEPVLGSGKGGGMMVGGPMNGGMLRGGVAPCARTGSADGKLRRRATDRNVGGNRTRPFTTCRSSGAGTMPTNHHILSAIIGLAYLLAQTGSQPVHAQLGRGFPNSLAHRPYGRIARRSRSTTR